MPNPALLLDVDGVLCPFGFQSAPEGFDFHTFNDGMGVYISAKNTTRIRDLQEDFEVVWCTAWEHSANDVLAPIHSCGPFKVIEFSAPVPSNEYLVKFSHSPWKLPWVVAWGEANDRPLVWVDDDLSAEAQEWAEHRTGEHPTLLRPIQPEQGLSDLDVTELQAWARSLS